MRRTVRWVLTTCRRRRRRLSSEKEERPQDLENGAVTMRLSNLMTVCLLAAVAAVAAPVAAAGAAPHDSRPAAAVLRAPGPYVLQNENSGLCLTARAGSGERPAVQTTCSGLPDQSWEM